MDTHFYLSFSPMEALIASQLEPEQFGAYMALGAAKNGSRERIMFFEVDGGFGDYFDWNHAAERCVPHSDGAPKHSLWLAVYRVLENTPLSAVRALYLTTQDGRTLRIDRAPSPPGGTPRRYYLYQELAPVNPLVASSLSPARFASFMTNPEHHVYVPTVIFADLKVIDFDDLTRTGHLGAAYDRNVDHLKECVAAVQANTTKPNKNVERSVASFSYQLIRDGVYFGTAEELAFFPMPDGDEIRRNHYDWGRSAMIL